jgi:hypothetical protein
MSDEHANVLKTAPLPIYTYKLGIKNTWSLSWFIIEENINKYLTIVSVLMSQSNEKYLIIEN